MGGPEGWEQEVRSYAVDSGDCFVLIDPIAPPSLVDELASGKQAAVVLTGWWHERDAHELVERLGVAVHAPSEDERTRAPMRTYSAGGSLPGGIEARNASYSEEAVLWIPAHGALVFGDVMLGHEGGIRVKPDSWAVEGVTPERLRDVLGELLDLPVELLLPTHGDPVLEDARGALKRALAG